MEILEKLFGSAARVKIMKIFLFHANSIFDKAEILKRAKITSTMATKELNLLIKIGMIKKKSFFKEFKLRTGDKKKRIQGYSLNPEFRYLLPLQNMLIKSTPMQNKELITRLSKAGKVKLIVVAGVFIQDPESRLDLLVAGDEMKKSRVKAIVSDMEANIGKKLNYTVFDTADLKYRLGICDRLVRDVFDYPHEIVVDRIGL